jgi:hypothetical protein
MLSSLSDGRFTLNRAVVDSAELVRLLPTILAPRPEKIVMVQVDSARHLDWVLPAIRRSGGFAYRPDSNCLLRPLRVGFGRSDPSGLQGVVNGVM